MGFYLEFLWINIDRGQSKQNVKIGWQISMQNVIFVDSDIIAFWN